MAIKQPQGLMTHFISTYGKPFLFFLALFPLLITAMRPAEKYSIGLLAWLIYAVGFIAIFWIIWRFRNLKFNTVLSVLGVTVYGVLTAIFYPVADAMKLTNQGQDQDDCTILVAQQLFRFDFPYDETSYFGNPCSPLPGAVIPYMPFVALDVFLVANAVILAVFSFLAVRYSSNRESTTLGLLLVLGIPQTLELSVAGSDLIFMGFGLLLAVILLEKSLNNPKFLFAATLLMALITSSRISTPVLAVVFLGWLWIHHRNRFWKISAIYTAVAGLPTILIFLWNPEEFSPLHLLAKGTSLVPGGLYVVMVLITLASYLLVFANKRFHFDPPLFFAIGFSAHILFLSFGDLVFSRNFDFATWEGANYMSLIAPLWLFVVARRAVIQRQDRGSIASVPE